MAKRRPRLADEEWEKYKEDIISLYQKTSLECLIQLMDRRHGFCASKNQYTRMFKIWGIRKNSNTNKWKFVDKRTRKRQLEGKASNVFLYGNYIPQEKVEREIARHVTFTDMYYNANDQDVQTPDGLAILTPPEAMVSPSLNGVIRIDNLPWHLFNHEVQSQTVLSRTLSDSTMSMVGEPFDIFAHPICSPGLQSFEASYGHQDLVSSSTSPAIFGLDNRIFNSEGIFDPLPDRGLPWNFLEHQVNGFAGMNTWLNFIPIKHEVQSAFLSVLLPDKTKNSPETKLLASLHRTYIVEDNRLEFYTPLGPNNQWNLTSYPNSYQLFSLFIFMVTNNLLGTEAVGKIYAWTKENCCTWIFTEVLKLKLTTIDVFATKLFPAAVQVGDVELVHKLISRNVSIDTPIKRKWCGKFQTALSLAVGERNVQMAEVLCDLGATPKVTQDDTSAANRSCDSLWSPRNIEMLRLLLRYGADPECFVSDEPRGYPLIGAAFEGSVKAVSQLLAAGANVNLGIPGYYGTALQAAAACGHVGVVRVLIEARAGVNMTCMVGHPLEHSRSPSAWMSYNGLRTPIQLAARANNAEIVLLLLQSGALVNLCPMLAHFGLEKIEEVFSLFEERKTSDKTLPFAFAIQYAAQNENISLVHQLLAAGAIVDSRIGLNYGDTPLQIAARLGNVDLMSILLNYNAGVNAPSGKYNGRTAIQGAAESGNSKGIQMLLDAHANVNASPGWRNGRTAIQAAIEKGNINEVRRLLLAGADINAKPAFSKGLTALQAAILFGDVGIIKEVLGYGADINAAAGPGEGLTALQAAVRHKNIDLLNFLLQAGADVNALPSKGSNRTALQYAVCKDWLEGAKLLLDYNSDVHMLPPYEDIEALSALGWSIDNGNHDMMVILFDYGASPNAPVLNNEIGPPTAFLYALDCATSYESIELFVKRGADISQCWDTKSVLEIAVESVYADVRVVQMILGLISQTTGNYHSDGIRKALASITVEMDPPDIDLLRLLLDAGADINAKDPGTEQTILQKSVIEGHIEVVKFLLQNEAEVNIPANRDTGTPLQEAIKFERVEIADLLIEHGADVNAPPAETEGVTALQAAAIGGYNRLAVNLLTRGADVTAAQSPISGRTAINGAAEHGRLEMLQLLLNAYGDREELPLVCSQAATFAQKEGHEAIAGWLRAYMIS